MIIVSTPETRANNAAFEYIANVTDNPQWHEGWVNYDSLFFYYYGIFYAKTIKVERDAMADKIADKASRGDYN